MRRRGENSMQNDENKTKKKKILGLLLMISGIVLTVIALSTFFINLAKTNNFSWAAALPEMSKLYLIGLVGLPFIGIGAGIYKFAGINKY